jgi:hypothetical protein
MKKIEVAIPDFLSTDFNTKQNKILEVHFGSPFSLKMRKTCKMFLFFLKFVRIQKLKFELKSFINQIKNEFNQPNNIQIN